MLRVHSFTGASKAKGRTGSREFIVGSKWPLPPQARLKRDALCGSEGRHPPLHILFAHSHAAEVERCVQELDRVHFTVTAEIVVTPEEFSERLGRGAYDLVVAEYPSPNWHETQALELLNRSKRQIPLIFVGRILQRETVAEFITRGAYDCIKWGALVIWLLYSRLHNNN